MEETKNIFHKTGKGQGHHVIISFSAEKKVTAEQAMYVLEHFAKDVLGDDYEAVYAVHTDREHMHGHLDLEQCQHDNRQEIQFTERQLEESSSAYYK